MVSTRRSSRLRRSTPQPPGSFRRESSLGLIDQTPTRLDAVREDDLPKPTPPTQTPAEKSVSPAAPRNPFSSLLSTLTSRTPKRKTPILPTHAEMHPSQHQQSTTKPLEEARWLGIMPMTEPPKKTRFDTGDAANTLAVAQATPTRATQSTKAEKFLTPEGKLSFKRKASFDAELSPEAQRIMEETREEAAKIRARMTAAKERQEAQDQIAEEQPVFGLTNPLGARKIAKPKGRFSDAHKKQFVKMGSIADHPSAFRADANRTAVLPLNDQPSKSLKRTHSKSELQTTPKSNLPVKSAFTPIPARDPFTPVPSKRVKLTAETVTTSAQPTLGVSATDLTQTRLPLPQSSVGTPTKASIARSQSAKGLRTKTSIPTLKKAPSMKKLTNNGHPTKAQSHDPAAAEDLSVEPTLPQTLHKSPSIRSILRAGPTRLYSDDPAKVAAGTHLPTPTRKSLLPLKAPATAPVTKHVDFTESTKERDDSDGSLDSPLNVKIPESLSAIAAQVDTSAGYPTLPAIAGDTQPARESSAPPPKHRPIATPKARLRRQTMGPTLAARSAPSNDFTFRIGNAPSFAAATAASTIRRVRSSDAGTPPPMAGSESVTVSKKRKLDAVEEPADGSDKENSNSGADTDGQHPAKKARTNDRATPRKPVNKPVQRRLTAKSPAAAKSPGPTKGGLTPRKGGLTLARLNLLATPKHKRT